MATKGLKRRSMRNLIGMRKIQEVIDVEPLGRSSYILLKTPIYELEPEVKNLGVPYDWVKNMLINMVADFSTPPSNCENFHVQNQIRALKYTIHELKQKAEKVEKLEKKIQIMKMKFTNLTNTCSKSKIDTLEHILNVEQKIATSLSLYDADKLGIIDYALKSAGGAVISISNTIPYPSKIEYTMMGLVPIYTYSDPSLVIQAGSLPGECFAFRGQVGSIRIKLARLIQVTSVTLEHTHKNLVADISSCPKDFRVYGLGNIEDKGKLDLGTFTYLVNGSTIQNFSVKRKFIKFQYVELEILNNYGNNDYTCIYRFRVHGNLV